jgi:hypothetical protein
VRIDLGGEVLDGGDERVDTPMLIRLKWSGVTSANQRSSTYRYRAST